MANFCTDCGRPIQEGSTCVCKKEGQVPPVVPNHQEQQPIPQINYDVNVSPMTASLQTPYQQPEAHHQPQAVKNDSNSTRKFAAIGQIVTGGVLFLFGMLTGGMDWSYISYIAGAGFIMTGTCGMICLGKDNS